MSAQEQKALKRLTYKTKVFKNLVRVTFLAFDVVQVAQALF